MPNQNISIEDFVQRKVGAPRTPTPGFSSSTPASPQMMPSQTRPQGAIPIDEFVKKKATTPAVASTQGPEEPGMLESMAKGIFSAPATMIARPFQAAAAVAGASNEQIDKFSQNLPVVGGLIADAPDTLKDVKKDIGRGVQTVALGTAAPIAGGAAFGVGTSLEQGNDLLSAETAFNAATGGAAGKVLTWVGKPILNASGKVVGTITPQMIKDAAAGGAQSIQKFMADNQLLGGVAAKPSAAIANTFQKVDDTIEGGVKKVFTGTGKAIQSQYPGANMRNHFIKKNEEDLIKPTTINKPGYSKARQVETEAKRRDIDLGKVLTKRRIQMDDLKEGGSYNTVDVAKSLRQQNMTDGELIIRTAIKEMEPSVQTVPISKVRDEIISEIKKIPNTKLSAAEKNKAILEIQKMYADDSAEAASHPNGYTLTDFHDARIRSGGRGKYRVGSPPSEIVSAQKNRAQERAFARLFDTSAPKDSGLREARREFEENFLLADYLQSLHGKRIPEGPVEKAVRLFGGSAAAIVGGKVGGFPGAVIAGRAGDLLFNSFDSLPSNPLKGAILRRLEKEDVTRFTALRDYLGRAQTEQLMRLALPGTVTNPITGKKTRVGGPETSSQGPRLFGTSRGNLTPNRQEAADMAAVESGAAKRPLTEDPRFIEKVIDAQENLGAYLTPSQMESIMMGNKVKLKLQGRVIDIDANDLPKVFGPNLKNPPEPYIAEKDLPVIDFGPKPRKKKSLNDIYID